MEQAHLDRYLEYVRAERGLGARTVDEYGQERTIYVTERRPVTTIERDPYHPGGMYWESD